MPDTPKPRRVQLLRPSTPDEPTFAWVDQTYGHGAVYRCKDSVKLDRDAALKIVDWIVAENRKLKPSNV